MSNGTSAELRDLILCDQIITDRETGKRSLIGVFQNFNVTETPTTYGRIWIYATFTGGRRKQKIKIECRHLATEELTWGLELQVKVADPTGLGEFCFPLPHVPLPKVGAYEITVHANDGFAGRRKFSVNKIPAKK